MSKKGKRATKASTRKGPKKSSKKPLKKPAAHAASVAAASDATPVFLGLPDAVGALVDVEIEKLPGSPNLVRVRVVGQAADVIAPGQTKGVIRSVRVGSFIVIWVFVTGNPGATASLKISKATPSSVKVSVPPDSGQGAESQSLLVTG